MNSEGIQPCIYMYPLLSHSKDLQCYTELWDLGSVSLFTFTSLSSVPARLVHVYSLLFFSKNSQSLLLSYGLHTYFFPPCLPRMFFPHILRSTFQGPAQIGLSDHPANGKPLALPSPPHISLFSLKRSSHSVFPFTPDLACSVHHCIPRI